MVKRTMGWLNPGAVHTRTGELWTHPNIQLLSASGIHALALNLKFWLCADNIILPALRC